MRRDRKRERKGLSLFRPAFSGPHEGSLRLVAFSDYHVQDIALLVDELRKLRPVAGLVLYAGDAIERFHDTTKGNILEAVAATSKFALCAVAGNDDSPSDRDLIRGKGVFNVHIAPVIIGPYAVMGIDGAPFRRDLPGLGSILHSENEIRKHLDAQKRAVGVKKLIVLSHSPPEGILDSAQRFSPDGKPRPIGSRSLRRFLILHRNVAAVICGHVHRCGGQHKQFGRATVVNASNHDDYKAGGRFAVVDLDRTGKAKVEWHQIREVSIVPGIAEASAQRLRGMGVRTVEELAATSIIDLQRVPYLGHSPQVLKARAQAIVAGKAKFIRPPVLPVGRRLFLDIETDLRQEYVWLIGVVCGEDYSSLFAETPNQEREILLHFLQYVDQYPNATILSLSGSEFEKRVLSKRLAFHGLPVDVCKRIVDLFWILTPSIALPTKSYRVKEVGDFFGYSYKHPDLDGSEVASLYENEYQRMSNRASRRRLAKRLVEYNEDDTRCLSHILRAIDRLQARWKSEETSELLSNWPCPSLARISAHRSFRRYS